MSCTRRRLPTRHSRSRRSSSGCVRLRLPADQRGLEVQGVTAQFVAARVLDAQAIGSHMRMGDAKRDGVGGTDTAREHGAAIAFGVPPARPVPAFGSRAAAHARPERFDVLQVRPGALPRSRRRTGARTVATPGVRPKRSATVVAGEYGRDLPHGPNRVIGRASTPMTAWPRTLFGDAGRDPSAAHALTRRGCGMRNPPVNRRSAPCGCDAPSRRIRARNRTG